HRVEDLGRARVRHLLGVDDLLVQAGAAAAVLARPLHREIARIRQPSLPHTLLLAACLLVGGHRRRTIRDEPRPELGAERFLLRCEAQLEHARGYSRTRMWITQTLPPPIMWQRPTRAFSRWRFPASPRNCSVVSQICASPVGPPGWPRAMRPPSLDT